MPEKERPLFADELPSPLAPPSSESISASNKVVKVDGVLRPVYLQDGKEFVDVQGTVPEHPSPLQDNFMRIQAQSGNNQIGLRVQGDLTADQAKAIGDFVSSLAGARASGNVSEHDNNSELDVRRVRQPGPLSEISGLGLNRLVSPSSVKKVIVAVAYIALASSAYNLTRAGDRPLVDFGELQNPTVAFAEPIAWADWLKDKVS